MIFERQIRKLINQWFQENLVNAFQLIEIDQSKYYMLIVPEIGEESVEALTEILKKQGNKRISVVVSDNVSLIKLT